MGPFTEKEIEYLRGQRLGRLATVGFDGSPHVVPVGFRLDAEAAAIELGGHALSRSKKWRDLQANPRVAFVVDDLVSVNPWTPRGLEVRGRAEFTTGAVRARCWLGLRLDSYPAAADCQLGDRAVGVRGGWTQRPLGRHAMTVPAPAAIWRHLR